MTKKLFVGNLAYAMTDDQLLQIFSAHGKVVSANIIKDRFSGRSKGFAFVEFETEAEAEAAMKALDGSEQEGRNLVVKEATPRPDSVTPPMEEAAPEAETEVEAPVAPMEEVAETAPADDEADENEEEATSAEVEAPVAPMEEAPEEETEEPTE